MSNKPTSFKRLEVQYGFRTKKSLDERTDKKAMALKAKQRSYNRRVGIAIQAAKKFVIKSISTLSRTIKVNM